LQLAPLRHSHSARHATRIRPFLAVAFALALVIAPATASGHADLNTASVGGSGYATAVLADGPTGYWRLGESSGTSAADSAGSHAGTINGGVTLGVPGSLSGDPDTAMTLNGSTGYVSVASSTDLNPTGDLTVEAWAKPTALTGIGGAILHKGGTSGYSVWQYRLSITSGNQWRGTVFIGGNAFTVTAPGTPSTSSWTYLAMTRSGNTLTLYVNGTAVATSTASGALNTSTGILAIGRTGSSSSDYFNGSIDEAAVYPTALTATRINAHYNAGLPPAAPPMADFGATPTTGAAPLNVGFTDQSTNSPTSWAWDFGDGGSSTSQNPSHTYSQAGTYTVSHTATNASGSNTATKAGYISVGAPAAPVADFGASPTSGLAPLQVTFADQSTNTPTSWSWDFGDGTTSTLQNPSHTYSQPGTYTVSLTAGNASGTNTKTRTGYITVGTPPPAADFTADSTTGPAPLQVTFTDQSTNTPTGWSWDFGDGGSSTSQNPSHTYNQPGTYTVSLTATNTGGSNTKTRTGYVAVSSANGPTADFTATNTSGPAPLQVTFSDRSTGTPTSWSWDFGDGTGSTAQNPSHLYQQAGSYTVSLTVSNAGGSNTKTTMGFVAVSDPVLVGAGDIADCSSTGDDATAKLLAAIPGTVFTIGDNAYDNGTSAEFSSCYGSTWGQFRSRTHPTPGNHDYLTANAAGYFGYFGTAAGDPSKGYYSYDLGTWHIIALNSECSFIGGCDVGSPEEQWLRADLAAHPNTCTLAMWHRPRFSSGATGSETIFNAFWQDLYNAGADVVLAGHDHDYERFVPQDPNGTADPMHGIREFIVGTGGKSLTGFNSPVANSVVRNFSTYGVLKLTLHPTSYDWQFVPIAGGTFTDSGNANCVGAAPPPPPPPTVGPYRTEVLADSPAAYWRLGESSGSSALDSSGTNIGTINSGVTLGVPGALSGDSDTAMTFNGTSGFVSVPSSPALNPTGDLTVEAWVKPTVLNGSGGAIVHKGGTSGNSSWQYRLSLTSANQWRATVYIGGTAYTVTDTRTPSTSSWTYLALTRSGTTLTLYVNGTPVGSTTAAGALNSNSGMLAIGRTGASSTTYFSGSIDEVAVYPSALSTTRISAHYLAGTTSSG
jgi:PKD repeat protein